MLYSIPLVTLNGPEFKPQTVRTWIGYAEDAFDALFQATDTISEAEADHVFASYPASPVIEDIFHEESGSK